MTAEKTLNFKLILTLSLFGLAMGLATIWLIPSKIEPVFWFAIFLACAVIIARNVSSKHFLHGFSVSLANCFWITSAHIAFYGAYLANHPEEAEMLKSMPMPDAPRLMMAMTGPVIGIISGLVLGGFAFAASKLIKQN
jgi:hypothetical protein